MANISARLTQPKTKKQLTTKKGNMSEENKEKKDKGEVRDLEPKKDAKGGYRAPQKGVQGTHKANQ